jgi:hypothetical protein
MLCHKKNSAEDVTVLLISDNSPEMDLVPSVSIVYQSQMVRAIRPARPLILPPTFFKEPSYGLTLKSLGGKIDVLF